MKEDTELKNRIGKENPFKVPEGYFDSIVPEIMKQLPEAEVQENAEITNGETASVTDSVQGIPDEYIDPILDQTMMDDYTLYMYLTDADLEIYN